MAGRQPRTEALAVRRAVRAATNGAAALIPPGSTLVVAVSGGPDSTALLHALTQTATRARLHLHVAHLHHGLRGREADGDADYVRTTAAAWGLPCTIGSADVRAIHRSAGGSLEAVARRLRYQFLAQVARDAGAAHVAVAHTADDQAETVLLRLLRGTGVTGLAGMAADAPLPFAPTSSNLRAVRPLLGITRAQVEAYCDLYGLQPRRDSSNAAPEFTRNRIRHEVLPLLRTINPSVAAALNRLAAHAAADDAALTTLTEQAWPEVATASAAHHVQFSLAALQPLPVAVQTRLVRRALAWLRGGPDDADTAETDAVLHLLSRPGTASAALTGGIVAWRSYGELRFVRTDQAAVVDPCGPPLGAPVTLLAPGEVSLPGWRLTARLLAAAAAASGTATPALVARLDAAAAGAPLTVRAWQPGDRIQPLGMTGHRKLQDLFVDAKVPARCRHRIPIVAGPRGIIWVVGHTIGHPFRLRPDAGGSALVLTADRLPAPLA